MSDSTTPDENPELEESLRRIISANRKSREAYSNKMGLLTDAIATGGNLDGFLEGESSFPLGDDGEAETIFRSASS